MSFLERFFTSFWATMGQPFLEISQALVAGKRGRWKGWKERELAQKTKKQVFPTIPKHLFLGYIWFLLLFLFTWLQIAVSFMKNMCLSPVQ